MRYTQKEVLEVLRKNPASSLWNYTIKDWSDNMKAEFEKLKSGEKQHIKSAETKTLDPNRIKKNYSKRQKKIVRVEDGIVYDSVFDCAIKNGTSMSTVSRSANGYTNHNRFAFYVETPNQ